jgi:14-3-3 protein epsilon
LRPPCPSSRLLLPELEKICQELLDVLEKHLLPEDHSAEGQVFYWKMAGDYWRYLAEFATADDRKAKAESAKQKYEKATKTAQEKSLPPTNPIRLGLALNYSVRPWHARARSGGRGAAQART